MAPSVFRSKTEKTRSFPRIRKASRIASFGWRTKLPCAIRCARAVMNSSRDSTRWPPRKTSCAAPSEFRFRISEMASWFVAFPVVADAWFDALVPPAGLKKEHALDLHLTIAFFGDIDETSAKK